MDMNDINLATVLEARGRIQKFVVKSPLKPSFELGRRSAAQVFLKLENMQDTGSFKIRGAANAILKLSEEGGAAGVVAASSGNHGAGSSVCRPTTRNGIHYLHDQPGARGQDEEH